MDEDEVTAEFLSWESNISPGEAIDPVSQFVPSPLLVESPDNFFSLFWSMMTFIGLFIYILPTIFLAITCVYSIRALANFQKARALSNTIERLKDNKNV